MGGRAVPRAPVGYATSAGSLPGGSSGSRGKETGGGPSAAPGSVGVPRVQPGPLPGPGPPRGPALLLPICGPLEQLCPAFAGQEMGCEARGRGCVQRCLTCALGKCQPKEALW